MNRNRQFSLHGVAISGLVILFFVSIILAYYFMLLSETRERITKAGELNAMTSAEQIDQYLSQGVVTMNLVCYTLDSMIRAGKSQAEIRGFLVNQSDAILNSTLDTTGLYGYIRGEILAEAGEHEEVITADCDFAIKEQIRNSIHVFRDRRPEIYQL